MNRLCQQITRQGCLAAFRNKDLNWWCFVRKQYIKRLRSFHVRNGDKKLEFSFYICYATFKEMSKLVLKQNVKVVAFSIKETGKIL